ARQASEPHQPEPPPTCVPQQRRIKFWRITTRQQRKFFSGPKEVEMSRAASSLMFLAVLALPGSVSALICTADKTPAATLLLPYFEVDLSPDANLKRSGKRNTIISFGNAGATAAPRPLGRGPAPPPTGTAVLAHVVIWSDLSVPVLDFNVYLTGYDVQTISLLDVIGNGRVPGTASAGQDPTDTISPKGVFSQKIHYASWASQLPPPELPPALRAHVQAALNGKYSSLLNACAGSHFGDNVA